MAEPVRVRLLSKFARLGASSRLRMFQYLPSLERLGIMVEPRPLLPDAYVTALFGGKPNLSRLIAARNYAKRIHELWRPNTADVDWVEGELLPFFPRRVEASFRRGRRPFVAEYDDALFYRYSLSSSTFVRSVLGTKIDAVMREAACVIVGNRYLAQRALQVGAARVEIIPTVVDVHRYAPVMHQQRPRLVIGWIGSPVTQHYLLAVHEPLREICARHDAVLRLVGARKDIAEQLSGVPVECVPWTEQDEASQLSGMDIGIMPLLDAQWERGKCGYKLVQYMACGLPVVASPVGINSEIVTPDVNGFLPVSAQDWVTALSSLLSSVELRRRLGMAGRVRVEAELCIQVQAPRLAGIMRSIAACRM